MGTEWRHVGVSLFEKVLLFPKCSFLCSYQSSTLEVPVAAIVQRSKASQLKVGEQHVLLRQREPNSFKSDSRAASKLSTLMLSFVAAVALASYPDDDTDQRNPSDPPPPRRGKMLR